ncbi:MAG: VacJ family lipoprotein [Pseudomonadota bacterium]
MSLSHRLSTPLPTALAITHFALTLASCATRPPESDPMALAAYEEANDPLEPFNRGVYAFNNGLQTVLLEPLARGYRFITPQFARTGISNAFGNLREPVSAVNGFLQGSPERAVTSLERFVINSTVGLGGLVDVAATQGRAPAREDFGQTLGVWGLDTGPYLVLPILGPSSVRDGFGFAVNTVIDPFFWVFQELDANTVNLALTGFEGVTTLEANLDQLKELQKSSLDPYATFRSAYRQARRAQVYNGNPPLVEDPLDDPFEDGFDDQ